MATSPSDTLEQEFLEPSDPREEGTDVYEVRADEELTEEERAEDLPVYVISIAAELADLHPQTLRTYEREGLISPHRTEGGTRRYSERDVERLKFIKHLTQEEGLNLAGVRIVLDLGEKLTRTRHRVQQLEEMVRTLAARLEDDGDDGPRYEIVKSPGRSVEVHPQLRRRRRRRDREGYHV